MKNTNFRSWWQARTRNEILLSIVIIILIIMIATRWAYISHTAAESIKNRFVPTKEHLDSMRVK